MSLEVMPASDGLQIVTPSALESLTRGEIDMQIATAHRFPRQLSRFTARAKEMATMDPETAESCIYVRPVGKENGRMKYAEGYSVRLAEIVAATYGNMRFGSMIIDQTPRKITCRGFAHDLETNVAVSVEVVESTVKADGTPYSERQAIVVAKAALSKALRDAVFRVIPKAICRPIERDCRALIAGDAKSLEQRRASVLQWVQRLGIDEDRVWRVLEIKGPEDITGNDLITLNGLKTAIKDQDTTIDEAFPPIVAVGKVGAAPTTGNPMADAATPKAAAKPAPKVAPAPEPPPAQEEDDIPMEEAKPSAEVKAPAPATPAAEEAGEEPEKPTTAHADVLRKQIITRAKAANIGKAMVVEFFGGLEAWDKLDAKTLTEAVDNWGETLDAIRAK